MDLKEVIKKQAEQYDSFYLYDENVIKENVRSLKKAFPEVEFLYSIKCNPERHVLDSIFAEGFGADAASLGEVIKAKDAGLPKEKIYYSAPGKTVKDIREAIGYSVIIADSLYEMENIDRISAERNTVTDIGVRINPAFSYFGEDGTAGPSKFGIDEDQFYGFLENTRLKNIRITGLHVHLRSQELDPAAILRYYEKMTMLASRIKAALGAELEYVNMGSGIGITFSPEDKAIDIAALGSHAKACLDEFRKANPHTRVIIETGRYASGKSGIYVTKVLDRKVSHGKTFLILKNTLNGFVRPALTNMARLHAGDRDAAMWEPMFTSVDAFQYSALKDGPADEKVTLVGNLCTSTDMVVDGIMMPHLEPGDLIIMNNAGAYAAVMTPMQFASLEPPKQLFLTVDGRVLA